MRTRIVALAVLTSVLATCLFAVPLAVAVLDYSVQHERTHLERAASYVAIEVSGEVYDGDPIDPEDLEVYDEDYAVAVFDEDGDRQAGAVPGDHSRLLSRALDGEVGSRTGGDLLLAAFPITHSDDVVGAVLVATPRTTVLLNVSVLWGAMAGLAAAAVAVAWLVGRRQARRLARPLEDLEESARRLGDGDFSVRSHRGGIEEIDAVGAALDATAMRLDELLARERAFSADASHQLRTPLAGMRLRLEAALERSDADPRPAIAATLVDADRLEAIIDELLTLARVGQRARDALVEPLDLDTLIGELSPEWGARLALHGRDLAVRVDPDAPHARASGAAVRQVLGVLLDNAVTHGRGTVTVAVREAPGAVAVDVADEGPGVHDPENVLFAHQADRRDGHGIGLALARRLVEAEQGRLTLTRVSPPVFTLLLPTAVREDDAVPARQPGG
ncbi:Signal transduction histidine kinase [Geodermatophilus siccatus]|uniref:Signal transduction histidine-protein kinase/phosphatase MprB n=1 Tax=Geodermatophilus siccatus TaxID=1137991 RepID=A0A1G9TL61_9ACTN|nr:HAMP domain-containing sensor histidine kinase [Geodermatophilus siccatus]SDM47855.1 Signal transduction histidine kinase [Geodermatophilus siccatus]